MRKQILTVTLSALFGLGAAFAAPVAQDQPAPNNDQQQGEHHRGQPDPQKQLQFMTKKLNLTADQQNQILPILTAREQQLQAIRNDSSLSREDRRAKVRGVMQDSHSKIEAILNDTQKQTFEQMRPHGRGDHEQGQNQDNSKS